MHSVDLRAAHVTISSCPVCGGESLATLGVRADGIPVARCERCGMGFVTQRPTHPTVAYDDAYYGGATGDGIGYDDYELVAHHSLAWVAELVRCHRPRGAVLDVGCATGHLLSRLGGAYERFGIEVNEKLSARCAAAGIQMLGPDIMDPALAARWAGRFDVITAIAVLEHVTDIRAALLSIRALLAPGGLLIFEVPLIAPARDNATWFTSSLEHVFYPTPEGLDHLFRDVFGLPLIGREVQITGYASTFVGAATRDRDQHGPTVAWFTRLLDAPLASLERHERRFRFWFDVIHAFTATPAHASLLAELPAEQITPPLLRRVGEIWTTGLIQRDDLAQAAARHEAGEAAAHHRRADLEREHQRALDQLAAERRQVEALQARVEAVEARAAAWEQQARDRDESLRAAAVDLETLRRGSAADLEALRSGSAADLEALQSGAAVLHGQISRLNDETSRLRADLTAREYKIQEMIDSTAWRITAPLRWVGHRGRVALIEHPFDRNSRTWRALRSLYRATPLSPVTKQRFRDLLTRRGLAVRPSQRIRTIASPVADDRPPVVVAAEAWPANVPFVSVIIPCVDYGRYVAEAVDSVLTQTFQDIEIIVVDGGSAHPESIHALRQLEKPRTTVHWRTGGRHMVGDNRNFGIARARGKYVCCLDADDLLRPTYFEKALFLLEAAGYDVVSAWSECFGDSTITYAVADHPTLSDMTSANQVTTCAVFRKSLWERAGGFRDAGRGTAYVYEDWRLWIRFAALGARIANIAEPLFRYRVHAGSLTHSPGVSSLAAQRATVIALEGDVLTDEAYLRSDARKQQRIEVADPLRNLARRTPADARPTILIAVPFLLVGGLERLLSGIATQLAASGFRLVIVTTIPLDPAFGDSTGWFEPATREIYHLPRFLDPGRWRQFVQYLIETRQPRLLWILGSAFFYDQLEAITSAWPQLKVIDSLFNTIGHTANNRKRSHCIDLTLVENREVEQWLRDAGERPERIRMISSGVDVQHYRPDAPTAVTRASLGIADEAFVLGFAGRLAEEKRPDWFVKIADRLRDDPRCEFVMTGLGPLEAETRRLITRLDLTGRVRCLGVVPDVRDYLVLYDALILPSSLDGRPMAVLESLAVGVPVIASRVGGLPELVQDDETGYLCAANDLDAFVDRVRRLAGEPETHARMKVAARRFAEDHLGADLMNEAYERAIREVIGLVSDPGPAAPSTPA